jgi:hypothetical protein
MFRAPDIDSQVEPSVVEAPPTPPTIAAVPAVEVDGGFEFGVETKRRFITRTAGSPRVIAMMLALLIVVAASVMLTRQLASANDRANRSQALLEAAGDRIDELVSQNSEHVSVNSLLRGRLNAMQDRIAEVKAAKVHTVVKTKIVTKEVPRWVPSGDGIEVDTTGFGGRIAIHDVQLTHAYGYTHLIGIAINRSGETVSYAQLGCTFVDADGRLLSNEMVNKAAWEPGQTWGFDCSAQVDGTGGMLRVDEMS